jgi:hypothetical protein
MKQQEDLEENSHQKKKKSQITNFQKESPQLFYTRKNLSYDIRIQIGICGFCRGLGPIFEAGIL